ncbi:hypothetical protein BDR07DRAFT_865014 [Suillus spraguei]|nr:hypothetical protein BDR07DRAFT_865014 [Suillus spraguei]
MSGIKRSTNLIHHQPTRLILHVSCHVLVAQRFGIIDFIFIYRITRLIIRKILALKCHTQRCARTEQRKLRISQVDLNYRKHISFRWRVASCTNLVSDLRPYGILPRELMKLMHGEHVDLRRIHSHVEHEHEFIAKCRELLLCFTNARFHVFGHSRDLTSFEACDDLKTLTDIA